MLIELLVVFVILGYLYSSGFLTFGSPWALAFSVGLVLVAAIVGWVMVHFVARRLVDSLFGFQAAPSKPVGPRENSLLAAARAIPVDGNRTQALRLLVESAPDDKALSRMLADEFLRRGDIDSFEAEKLRLVERGGLNMEEVVAVYNRLADVEMERGKTQRAVEFLRLVMQKYPDSPVARNAERRIAVLCAHGDEAESRA